MLGNFLGVGKPLAPPVSPSTIRLIANRYSLITFQESARVVEWQTRTFEGRMPKGMRVQVPPRADLFLIGESGFF